MYDGQINDARVHDIARAVVLELLMAMGVDASDPKALQELQIDFAHVRGWRRATQSIKSSGMKATVTFVVTSGLGYIVYLLSGHFFGGRLP